MDRFELATLDTAQLLRPMNDNENEGPPDDDNYRTARTSTRRRACAVSFLPDSSSDDNSENEDAEDTLEATVSAEFKLYKADKGCPMKSVDGAYNCPPQWWKIHHGR